MKLKNQNKGKIIYKQNFSIKNIQNLLFVNSLKLKCEIMILFVMNINFKVILTIKIMHIIIIFLKILFHFLTF